MKCLNIGETGVKSFIAMKSTDALGTWRIHFTPKKWIEENKEIVKKCDVSMILKSQFAFNDWNYIFKNR